MPTAPLNHLEVCTLVKHYITEGLAIEDAVYRSDLSEHSSQIWQNFAKAYEKTTFEPLQNHDFTSLGRAIVQSPHFELFNEKVRLTFLSSLQRSTGNFSFVHELLCRIQEFIHSLIFWTNDLDELSRQSILESLFEAKKIVEKIHSEQESHEIKDSWRGIKHNLTLARNKVKRVCDSYVLLSPPQTLLSLHERLDTNIQQIEEMMSNLSANRTSGRSSYGSEVFDDSSSYWKENKFVHKVQEIDQANVSMLSKLFRKILKSPESYLSIFKHLKPHMQLRLLSHGIYVTKKRDFVISQYRPTVIKLAKTCKECFMRYSTEDKQEAMQYILLSHFPTRNALQRGFGKQVKEVLQLTPEDVDE